MESSGSFTIEDIIGIVRRRWLMLVVPLVVCVPLAVAVAFLLPPTYRSTARILVESQQIPDSMARSTVAQSAAERIQLIQQRLLTRSNLLAIAAEVGLFADRPSMSPSDIVDQMRASTRIQGITLRDARSSFVGGVEIEFRSSTAAGSARVVNEFVSRMLAQNVQQRTDRAVGTLSFFNQEAERLAAELDQQARRITAFKTENQDALPSSLSSRQSELSMMRDRLFTRSTQRANLEERRLAMVRAIESGNLGDMAGTPQSQELNRLRNALVLQRATLSDSHPTVRLLNARIAALETNLLPEDAAVGVAGGGTSVLDEQIAIIDRELALIDQRNTADEELIAELETSVRRTPSVEMELASLERHYANLQVQYREAVLNRARAEMGERLEANQQAERFEVIEQAIPAESPISPNRPLIVAAGVAGGFGLGVGLMVLLEMLNRAIYTVRDMERRLDLRPIVSIPYIPTARERTFRTWRIRIILLALVIGIPLALYLIDRFYLPLPLVFDRVVSMLGLGGLVDAVGQRLGR